MNSTFGVNNTSSMNSVFGVNSVSGMNSDGKKKEERKQKT